MTRVAFAWCLSEMHANDGGFWWCVVFGGAFHWCSSAMHTYQHINCCRSRLVAAASEVSD